MVLTNGPSSDPYVKVYLGPRMAGRSSTVYKNLSPEWNEQVPPPPNKKPSSPTTQRNAQFSSVARRPAKCPRTR